MKPLKVKRFYGTAEAIMVTANACCDFVNDNKGIDVVQIVHSDNDVFLYYRKMNVSNIWCATFKLKPKADKVTVFFKFTEPHTLLVNARDALRKMYGDDVVEDATPLELSAWPKLKQA